MNARTTLLPMALALLTSAIAQTPRIVVQGGGAPQVFTDLAAAVAAAQADDKVYLSGGAFPYTGGLVIDKPLHFIGAGIIPDSSQTTGVTTLHGSVTNAPLVILTEASGSSFTGIRFTSDWDGSVNTTSVQFGNSAENDAPTNVVFQRCWFQRTLRLGAPPTTAATTNTVIDECVFMLNLVGENRSATVTRSIISGGIFAFYGGGLMLENSILFSSMQNISSGIVRNCWIRGGNSYATYDCANTVFENNVTNCNVIAAGSPGAVDVNNIVNAAPATFFASESNNYFEVTDDLHLAVASPGIGHSTDGTDVGIYGTSAPYKPGGVPYNPHYRDADIAPATNPNGELPVSIRVAAQTN